MTKKIISYKLNSDGTIPDYIYDGGHLVKNEGNISEMILIGISKPDADISGAEQEFNDEESIISYVKTYLSDHTYTNSMGNEVIFNIANEVSKIFTRKNI